MAAALALSGCAGRGPQLGPPTPLPAMVTQYSVPAHQPWTFGGIILCRSGPGTAVIRSVSIHPPASGLGGQLRVEAFAVRPNPFPLGQSAFGAEPTTLTAIGSGFVPAGPQLVTTVCPQPGELATWKSGSELAVQVSKDAATAFGVGLDIQYTSGSAVQTYSTPFGIALCALSTIAQCPPETTGGIPR